MAKLIDSAYWELFANILYKNLKVN